MNHLLKLLDLSTEEITGILDLADQLKYERKHNIPHELLKGQTLGMIFQKSSTRTRVSFETEPDRQIGLVEDVTKVTRERMNIEHERDYDTLTGLYNRRAFQRESEKLFREHPEKHNCENSFCS